MRKLKIFVLMACLSVLAVSETDTRKFNRENQDNNVLFVVDRSGSVAGSELDQYKSAIAVETSRNRERRFGLIHFSGCAASDVVYAVKLDHGTGPQVAEVVGGLVGGGGTALGLALQKAHEIMEGEQECIKLVLFTDHMETCGANLDEIQSQFDAYCMELNVISYAAERDLGILGELVRKSGGKIHQANHTKESVRRALEDIMKKRRSSGSFTTFGVPSEAPKERVKPKEKPKEAPAPKPYEYRQGTGQDRERGNQ